MTRHHVISRASLRRSRAALGVRSATRRKAQPESGVLRAVRDLLTLKGYAVQRLNSGGGYLARGQFVRFGFDGCPDLIVLVPGGLTVWLEVKAPGGKLNDKQIEFRDLCQRLHVPWACVTDPMAALRYVGRVQMIAAGHAALIAQREGGQ